MARISGLLAMIGFAPCGEGEEQMVATDPRIGGSTAGRIRSGSS
jgi:hypothetical protein